MTMEEAQEILQEIKHYLTAGNPVWDVDEIAEACDMAIEALRNEINCVKCVHYTERETYTGIKGVCKMDTVHREDLISRSRAIKEISECATDILHPKNLIKEDAIGILESLPSADEQDDNRLYIRIYANDEPSRKAEKLYQICGETESQEVAQWLKEYFPSVDSPTGEWIEAEVIPEVYDIEGVKTWGSKMQCDQCGFRFMAVEGHIRQYNYCPNCGAKMEGREP